MAGRGEHPGQPDIVLREISNVLIVSFRRKTAGNTEPNVSVLEHEQVRAIGPERIRRLLQHFPPQGGVGRGVI
jgi:hypothetical protein